MYIVEFRGGGCWLADWTGDPGRTVLLENAKRFTTLKKAIASKNRAIRDNNHRFKGDLTALEVKEVVNEQNRT